MDATMYLIYPGMTAFQPVTVWRPGVRAGMVWVKREDGSMIEVAASRLVDHDTAAARSGSKIIHRDGYTVCEHTVKIV